MALSTAIFAADAAVCMPWASAAVAARGAGGPESWGPRGDRGEVGSSSSAFARALLLIAADFASSAVITHSGAVPAIVPRLSFHDPTRNSE